jgi:hypothetical protein
VEDLARGPGEIGELARICFEAGARRFNEIVEYLQGRRQAVPELKDDTEPPL